MGSAAATTTGAVTAEAAAGTYLVYQSVRNEVVVYVGITRDLPARAAAHARAKGIDVDEIPGLSNLSKTAARGVEQALIELHGLPKAGGTLMNKINSIAASNPIYRDAVARGRDLLRQAGYE
jgi:filamentous hemagglutinin